MKKIGCCLLGRRELLISGVKPRGPGVCGRAFSVDNACTTAARNVSEPSSDDYSTGRTYLSTASSGPCTQGTVAVLSQRSREAPGKLLNLLFIRKTPVFSGFPRSQGSNEVARIARKFQRNTGALPTIGRAGTWGALSGTFGMGPLP